jgi:hypothetical protein
MPPDELGTMVSLVETVAERCFGGEIPAAWPELVTNAIMEEIPCLRRLGPEAKQIFRERLLLAIRARIAWQSRAWVS